jgi:hypothetical protein
VPAATHAEQGYSTTWSARSSKDCGIVKPSALAVLRLITSSNFVGCSTGRSAAGTLQDLIHVESCAPVQILKVRAI